MSSDNLVEEVKKTNYRIIFHIDMNCFFASCEIASHPELASRPIVIAHQDSLRKSIILTANYVARKYGIYTTMLVRDAIKCCPEVLVIEPNMEKYQYYSKIFFNYLHTITHKIEPMSIDEGFLDVTEVCEKINAIELANTIQKTLNEKYHLPCSIGIAPNKFLAKMASDMKKPLGITILRKREISTMLWPLSIQSMFGIGKKTTPKLNAIGIYTIGDLANYQDVDLLKKTIGTAMTESLIEYSHGNDTSIVQYERNDEVASINHSTTFDYDVYQIKIMKDSLKILMNEVINRMDEKELAAYNIGIQIKYSDFHQISRSRSVPNPTNDSYLMWSIIEDLFDNLYQEEEPVRLLGVFVNRLVENHQSIKQYSLFDDFSRIEKENDVHTLLRKINNQYGNIIHIGYNKKEEKK